MKEDNFSDLLFASMEDELFRKEINLLLSPIYMRKYTYIHVSLLNICYANFIHASEANTRVAIFAYEHDVMGSFTHVSEFTYMQMYIFE